MTLETTRPTDSELGVLHLAGSQISEFDYNLSIIHAKGVVQPTGVRSYYAVVNPDGFWQLGSSLQGLSPKIPLQEAIAKLPEEVDVVVPHMCCFPGVTSFRGLFEDILGLPVVGSPSSCTALAMNKAQTRSVVSASGVRVAKAQKLRRGDAVKMAPPFIVKPNSVGYSLGVALIKNESQIAEALEVAFEHDNTLLVEDYVPGREFRVGLIEHEGKLSVSSPLEYLLSQDHPIITTDDKVELEAYGSRKQLEEPTVKPVYPADVPPELFEKLADAAKRAHIALGCRDYSVYDFRVHSETNEPYLLEADLFWSFSKVSWISRMFAADGRSLEDVALELWKTAAKR